MKPFDIELAKQGAPVCTRDGHDARIICFDKIEETPIYPVIALVRSWSNKIEVPYCYTKKGRYVVSCESALDLMLK